MKYIKIILVVIVVSVLCFFLFKWSGCTPTIGHYQAVSNSFDSGIQHEIDSLKNFPENVFCEKLYKEIQYKIDQDAKLSLLDSNQQNNDQQKENLSKNLYSAYASKFIDQSMYVFNHSDWNKDDINFISNQVKELQSSSYLEQGSPVANAFNTILVTLGKYDEISDFISSCDSFTCYAASVDSSFPNVSDKLAKAKDYLNNNLDNNYVNNCNHLKEALVDIPKNLFLNHVKYIQDKMTYINDLSTYKNYNSQPDYVNNMYTPLRSQIDSLANNIYGVDGNLLSDQNTILEKKLSDLNFGATEYFRSKN